MFSRLQSRSGAGGEKRFLPLSRRKARSSDSTIRLATIVTETRRLSVVSLNFPVFALLGAFLSKK
jgi:hypothetical protein